MKKVLWLGLVVAAFGAVASLTSFPVERSYASKAKLVQRMKIDSADALFGNAGTPIGSPQMLIINDERAFTGEVLDTGPHVVDEGYLEKHKIYPLQLQTVKFVASMVRLGGGAAVGVGLAIAVFARRKVRKRLAPVA